MTTQELKQMLANAKCEKIDLDRDCDISLDNINHRRAALADVADLKKQIAQSFAAHLKAAALLVPTAFFEDFDVLPSEDCRDTLDYDDCFVFCGQQLRCAIHIQDIGYYDTDDANTVNKFSHSWVVDVKLIANQL